MRTKEPISGPAELLFAIVPEIDAQYISVSVSRVNEMK